MNEVMREVMNEVKNEVFFSSESVWLSLKVWSN